MVPTEYVEKIISYLNGLTLPAVPEEIAGFDGTTYTLIINQFFNCAQYTWWCEPPPGWEGLEGVRGMLQGLVRKCGVELKLG